MTLRMPIGRNKQLLLISAYAPTMAYFDEDIDNFYLQLATSIHKYPNDKLIIFGDFNARVGKDNISWKHVIGPNGLGEAHSNGEKVLAFCCENELIITNTLFKQANCRKGTRSRHWHMIDYVITRQQDRQELLSTCVMRGAECSTDHLLLCTKMRLQIQRFCNKRPSHSNLKLHVEPLRQPDTKAKLQLKLPDTPSTIAYPVSAWNRFREVVTSISVEILGKQPRKNQDWFDDNDAYIQSLLNTRNEARKRMITSCRTRANTIAFKEANSMLQRETSRLKTEWWRNKAEKLHGFADSNNLERLYSSLREVWGPQKHHPII